MAIGFSEFFGGMSRDNNIWYIKNFDVRIAPKCSKSTVAHIIMSEISNSSSTISTDMFPWYKSTSEELGVLHAITRKIKDEDNTWSVSQSSMRFTIAKIYGSFFDLPFRANSIKLAVSRDPIKRFISGLNFCYKSLDLRRTSEPWFVPRVRLTNDLEKNISMIENREYRNNHLSPLTFWYGNKNFYDKIFDISETDKLLSLVFEDVKSYDENAYNTIVATKKNVTSDEDRQWSVSDLTTDLEARVVKLYSVDYESGWV